MLQPRDHFEVPLAESQEDSESEQSTDNSRLLRSWHQVSEQAQKPYADVAYPPLDIRSDPLGTSERDSDSTNQSAKRQRIDQGSTSQENTIIHQSNEEDEFDIFGKHVAMQLKSLMEEDAVMAQEEIQSILTRYRLKKIRASACRQSIEIKPEVLL